MYLIRKHFKQRNGLHMVLSWHRIEAILLGLGPSQSRTPPRLGWRTTKYGMERLVTFQWEYLTMFSPKLLCYPFHGKFLSNNDRKSDRKIKEPEHGACAEAGAWPLGLASFPFVLFIKTEENCLQPETLLIVANTWRIRSQFWGQKRNLKKQERQSGGQPSRHHLKRRGAPWGVRVLGN